MSIGRSTAADGSEGVVGGANTGALVEGPRLPRPGATVQGALFQEAPGGEGADQAVAVALPLVDLPFRGVIP